MLWALLQIEHHKKRQNISTAADCARLASSVARADLEDARQALLISCALLWEVVEGHGGILRFTVRGGLRKGLLRFLLGSQA